MLSLMTRCSALLGDSGMPAAYKPWRPTLNCQLLNFPPSTLLDFMTTEKRACTENDRC